MLPCPLLDQPLLFAPRQIYLLFLPMYVCTSVIVFIYLWVHACAIDKRAILRKAQTVIK